MDACYKKDVNAACVALSQGADPNCRDTEEKGGSAPLFYACMNNQKDLVKELFAYGGKINEPVSPDGDTCLHAAAMCGATDLCKYLIENAAKKVQNKEGNLPEDAASSSGWNETSEYLKSVDTSHVKKL